MNYRLIMQQLGMVVLVLSAVLLSIWIWSTIAIGFYADGVLPLLWSTGISAVLGIVLFLYGRAGKNTHGTGSMGRREALLLVSSSWFLGAIVAAFPFVIWGQSSERASHPFHSVVNCFFEAMSGLTTTGATILSDISSVPDPLLFWRAMIQWLGGIGNNCFICCGASKSWVWVRKNLFRRSNRQDLSPKECPPSHSRNSTGSVVDLCVS